MTNPGVDWTTMWRWYHFKFFWILLAVGVLFRIVVARRYERTPWKKTNLFAITASVVSSVCAAWFPILPVLFGGLLTIAVGVFTASSLFVAAPLVAISMAIQTALIDVAILRLLLNISPKKSFVGLFFENLFITSLALSLVLAWTF